MVQHGDEPVGHHRSPSTSSSETPCGADIAPRLDAQAVAGQWDPATAVDWGAPVTVPDEVEAAVAQAMTGASTPIAIASGWDRVRRLHPERNGHS